MIRTKTVSFNQAGLRLTVFLLFCCIYCCPPAHAFTFKVATYNVENLFDARTDGTEYPDYVPGGQTGWTKPMADRKAANIAKVLAALSAGIVCLQEVESERALKLLLDQLQKRNKHYPYHAIAQQKDVAVRCAVISQFPITNTREIDPGAGLRAILEVTVIIRNQPLIIFVNHWKSKTGPESRRVACAVALKRRIDDIPQETDFVLAGDFNANYDEYRTFRNSQKLNDTGGITGINHILGTLDGNRMITEHNLKNSGQGLYNLWLELPGTKRWSHNFFGKKGSLDSILLPPALYDHQGISYVDDSFNRFAPDFLFHNRALFRWQRKGHGRGFHLGKGYSDHLPVFALFSTVSED
ncbi:MAG: endonuclease/exonuclease/phosphatase family protein [Thermodesulfobacteriota bacterium]|nr:endonuclease/exonuclease/phosphatase family protein [Thermodesulfobacteriota bacterium]